MSESLDFPFMCTIPYQVMADKELEPNAKIHYGCLVGLAKREGYCWATDEQLAEMHGVNVRQIKRWHASLEKQGHITRITNNEPSRNEDGKWTWKKRRQIYVGNAFTHTPSVSDKNVTTRKSEGDKNVTSDERDENVTTDASDENVPYKEVISKEKISKREHTLPIFNEKNIKFGDYGNCLMTQDEYDMLLKKMNGDKDLLEYWINEVDSAIQGHGGIEGFIKAYKCPGITSFASRLKTWWMRDKRKNGEFHSQKRTSSKSQAKQQFEFNNILEIGDE